MLAMCTASHAQVKSLRCGHFMHLHCYRDYIRRGNESGAGSTEAFWYRWPVCLKSMEDMTEYFAQIDAALGRQPMAPEYKEWKARILCHDCESYSEAPFHFIYHKCGECGSYNTRVEKQLPAGGSSGAAPPLKAGTGQGCDTPDG